MMRILKVKLIEIDNLDTKGTIGLGKVGLLSFSDKENGHFYFREVRSSPICSIEEDAKQIIIQTKNTKYTFNKEM